MTQSYSFRPTASEPRAAAGAFLRAVRACARVLAEGCVTLSHVGVGFYPLHPHALARLHST